MAHWLLKTEPETFSWDDQVKRGAKGEPWTGVRNFIARGNLKAMKKGDEAFFYHSGKGPAVVGVMRVTGPAVPDGDEGGWVKVPVAPVRPIAPVSLAAIKAESKLAKMELVRQSRLSVSPVRDEEWALILKMAGEN